MIKLRLPFGKKEEEFPSVFCALDLGEKLFKVFVFKVEEDLVRLLGARKAPRGEEQPGQVLKEIIEDLKSDLPDLPKPAVVGVSGPLTSAFTTVVRSSLAKGEEEIVKQARGMALKQAEKELRSALGDPKLSLIELEAEVLEAKEAEKMELYLFTSFGEKNYLRELEGMVRQAGLSLWGFSSLPFNLVGALSGGEELNALILDIGGEKTEVSLVFGGELMDTRSFWWDFGQSKKNPTLFLDLWLNSVSDTLGTFEEVKTFPSQILLVGGGVSFPDLVERVRDFPWGRDRPFDSPPEVSVISKDRLAGIHAEGTGLDVPEDILPLSLGQVALRVKEEPAEIEDEEDFEGED